MFNQSINQSIDPYGAIFTSLNSVSEKKLEEIIGQKIGKIWEMIAYHNSPRVHVFIVQKLEAVTSEVEEAGHQQHQQAERHNTPVIGLSHNAHLEKK